LSATKQNQRAIPNFANPTQSYTTSVLEMGGRVLVSVSPFESREMSDYNQLTFEGCLKVKTQQRTVKFLISCPLNTKLLPNFTELKTEVEISAGNWQMVGGYGNNEKEGVSLFVEWIDKISIAFSPKKRCEMVIFDILGVSVNISQIKENKLFIQKILSKVYKIAKVPEIYHHLLDIELWLNNLATFGITLYIVNANGVKLITITFDLSRIKTSNLWGTTKSTVLQSLKDLTIQIKPTIEHELTLKA